MTTKLPDVRWENVKSATRDRAEGTLCGIFGVERGGTGARNLIAAFQKAPALVVATLLDGSSQYGAWVFANAQRRLVERGLSSQTWEQVLASDAEFCSVLANESAIRAADLQRENDPTKRRFSVQT